MTPDERVKATIAEMERKKLDTCITIQWEAKDVLTLSPLLSAHQVADVLYLVRNKYDPEIGITWDTLREAIDYIKNG